MTSVASFNTLLTQFLDELRTSFPEETGLALAAESVADLCKINVRKPMELFVAALTPHAALVTSKNPDLFNQDLQLPAGLDIRSLWAKEDVPEETRNAIWSYVQMLFMLGTTVINLPPELLATIESVAQTCAAQMAEGGGGGMNFADLSQMLMGGLGSALPGMGDLAGMQALMSPSTKPRRTRPAKRR